MKLKYNTWIGYFSSHKLLKYHFSGWMGGRVMDIFDSCLVYHGFKKDRHKYS